MDRAIVIATLLLVGLTWLLYKLAVLLDPGNGKPSQPVAKSEATESAGASVGRQKPIHQRLRR